MAALVSLAPESHYESAPIPAALLADLQIVDQIVVERVQPRLAVIKIASQHILTSGGKRIRAALACYRLSLAGTILIASFIRPQRLS